MRYPTFAGLRVYALLLLFRFPRLFTVRRLRPLRCLYYHHTTVYSFTVPVPLCLPVVGQFALVGYCSFLTLLVPLFAVLTQLVAALHIYVRLLRSPLRIVTLIGYFTHAAFYPLHFAALYVTTRLPRYVVPHCRLFPSRLLRCYVLLLVCQFSSFGFVPLVYPPRWLLRIAVVPHHVLYYRDPLFPTPHYRLRLPPRWFLFDLWLVITSSFYGSLRLPFHGLVVVTFVGSCSYRFAGLPAFVLPCVYFTLPLRAFGLFTRVAYARSRFIADVPVIPTTFRRPLLTALRYAAFTVARITRCLPCRAVTR